MIRVENYYDVKVIEIEIVAEDKHGLLEDKITFIYNPKDDMNGSHFHSIYDLCENEVNDYFHNFYLLEIVSAFARVYTLDRQLVNQFDVL